MRLFCFLFFFFVLAFQGEPPDEMLHVHVLQCEGILLILLCFMSQSERGASAPGHVLLCVKARWAMFS